MMVLAALAAAGLVVTQWIAFKRAEHLADTQDKLGKAKEDLLNAELKVKDERIATANQQAAEAHQQAAKANEKAAEANEKAERERLARAQVEANLRLTDERVLAERRLTARERMRLERLERIALPRTVPRQQWNELVSALAGLGPINIAILQRSEPMDFGLELSRLFSEAGILGRLIWLSADGRSEGVTTYRVNRNGEEIARVLWQVAGIGGGSIGGSPPSSQIPAGENCLIVGENDAAFQGQPGQPGEGLDEHNQPVPMPNK
jgi:hypothetical protein